MKKLGRLWVGTLLVGSLLLLGGCAGKTRIQDPNAPDPKFSLSSYIEEGNLIALIACSRPTQFREDRPYIPIEIAVVNKNVPFLSLSRESFTLVDEDGNEYPAVSGEELKKGGYSNPDMDRRLGELGPVVRGRWQSYVEVKSNFTTTFDNAMEFDPKMARFNYLIDWLYFPTPEKGVKGRRFELFVRSPELEQPVFVRFAVAGKRLQEE